MVNNSTTTSSGIIGINYHFYSINNVFKFNIAHFTWWVLRSLKLLSCAAAATGVMLTIETAAICNKF